MATQQTAETKYALTNGIKLAYCCLRYLGYLVSSYAYEEQRTVFVLCLLHVIWPFHILLEPYRMLLKPYHMLLRCEESHSNKSYTYTPALCVAFMETFIELKVGTIAHSASLNHAQARVGSSVCTTERQVCGIMNRLNRDFRGTAEELHLVKALECS